MANIEEEKTPASGFAGRLGRWFLAPGDIVCDWLKVRDADSRMLLRMFVNLTVYGKLAILIVLPFLGL